jgi:hypothetical protein
MFLEVVIKKLLKGWANFQTMSGPPLAPATVNVSNVRDGAGFKNKLMAVMVYF